MTKVHTLKEASLGRILQHVSKNSKITSWGIISASRTVNPPKLNKSLTKKLESDLRSLNLGLIKLEGHWRECQDEDIPYSECPPDKLKDAVEVTFFVPNISQSQLAKLTSKYKQDASIFSDTPSEATLLFKNGSTTSLGKMSVGKIGQGFSKIKGRQFTFEQKISYIKSLTK